MPLVIGNTKPGVVEPHGVHDQLPRSNNSVSDKIFVRSAPILVVIFPDFDPPITGHR
jgi:hypothetical protein